MNIKYIAIAFTLIIGLMIATGNMGGAKDAATNYAEVRQNAPMNSTGTAQPSVIMGASEAFKEKKEGNAGMWLAIILIIGIGTYLIKRKKQ